MSAILKRITAAVTTLVALLAGTLGVQQALALDSPLPTLSYTVAGDSVKIVARWTVPCDERGCADRMSAQWTAGAGNTVIRNSGWPVPAGATAATVQSDSVTIARPIYPATTTVTVRVTAQRRNLSSAAKTASVTVTTSDQPPPAPGTIEFRVDTLDPGYAALRDSFPRIAVRRADGSARAVAYGETVQFCVVGRNRYTGEVALFIPAPNAPADSVAAYLNNCEPARVRYATEADQ